MTNNGEDPFEKLGNDFLFQDVEEEPVTKPKKKPRDRKQRSSRNFWVAAGVLIGLFVLMVVILSALTFFILPRVQTAREEQAALINAHNTATVNAATNSALIVAQVLTDTPTATFTSLPPTSTPIIVISTDTPEPTATVEETAIGAELDEAALTATADALIAEAAEEETESLTETPTATPTATSTELPETGLAENMGMTGLFGIALGLILVIVLVRKVRSTV